ncbi:MAG: HD domain-containing protein [Clostridia bacterium]|nr:HD domain-containing protein [Clostridia bacterium]
MKEYIEDLFKIYNSAIDSYNSKIMQRINEKYTIIDKSMIATYIYIKILENLNISDNTASDVLKNYLLKQIIYGETGNLALEISDKTIKKSYYEVVNKLIIEKFEYKNKIISKLKYNYTPIENNKYTKLIEFCEEVSEYSILEKIIAQGNIEAKKYLEESQKRLSKIKPELNASDLVEKEEILIITKIENDEFTNTNYNELIQIALNLKDVYRYSTLTTTIPENVLFHQYTITITSIIFAEYLNKEMNENMDIHKIMYKSLFHDFSEYKGNEIVTQVKNYNQDTIKLFAELEENDEKELKSKVGEEIYHIIKNAKKEKEGYIYDLIDKILGIAKLWIEIGYMHNYTYIKSICSIYQSRFKRFRNKDNKYQIDEIKNKEFLLEFLRESYIYIKEHMVNQDSIMILQYFTQEDVDAMKREIKEIKENPEAFLA